ncbi:dna excision repair protein ercc-8 [Zymoseptoria brevis]|uniref:Dna excision repair protein ercc-8 n=1 Tax=Zymoseptoria brevis TaxID=1047168 RepID=A0A0F4GCX4_9PEZI|nr:dna excision repair protein ercc-8 [Zymoseptoria brevis]
MNAFLLNRQLGSICHGELARAQNNRLLKALHGTDTKFALDQPNAGSSSNREGGPRARNVAHAAGVNSIAVDRFEGRYLISGGADSSLAIWDLEAAADSGSNLPLEVSARTSTTASLGITHLSFYPFDSLALLTTGYDGTLKLFSSETLQASATFDLAGTIYSHSTSLISTHLLVACAVQHPAVRLVDLRSGAATHSLPGHSGSVLSVAWHPRDENILASSATDGVVRLWDIRRSASSLGVLDLEDSIGLAGYDKKGTGARRRERGKSHIGAANGIVWTADGHHLVSNGHDERMRVWDMRNGANTLANFGPGLKNSGATAQLPLIAPPAFSENGRETIFYPNPKEILAFDMHSGMLQSRLRVRGLPGSEINTNGLASRNPRNRTTSLAWRTHHVEMYSGHGDGTIRCWRPRTSEDIIAEEEENEDEETETDAANRKRKREEFDRVVRDLTSQKKITFS